jgi:hypothetical protein
MKKGIVTIITSLFFLAAATTSLLAAEMTGKQVMEKQKELHRVKTELGVEIMLLVDKSGGKEKRNVNRYAKEMEDDVNRYLVVFLSPADIRATALLTWENKDRGNDQWLYMPATKKMQRIAKGSKKNYFMGTDFTYEDMEPEDIENFTYTILKTETINRDDKDQECWMIEAVPANKAKAKESGYSKRHLWIEKAYYSTLKADFFDRRKRLLKTQTSHKLHNVEGTVWRAKQTLMKHHQKNHKTLTVVTERKINKGIKDNVFTERFILTGKHVQ